MNIAWWIKRLPIYNSVILIVLFWFVAEAYYFSEFGPPEDPIKPVIVDLIKTVLFLNFCYLFSLLAEVIISNIFEKVEVLRWAVFITGTLFALVLLVVMASITLSPF